MKGRPRKLNRRVHPLARLLHQERISRKITLEQLSVELGYKSDSIGSWERGDYSPSIARMDDWCQALGFELKIERKS